MIEPAFDIEDHGHRLVRRSVASDGELCDAVMALAMGEKTHWTLDEIDALNRELDGCDLKISAWLEMGCTTQNAEPSQGTIDFDFTR